MSREGILIRAGRLAEDLCRYSAAMGPVNHDLVLARHRANVHAQELVELLRGLGAPAGRPREGLQEMARLARLEWRARAEVHHLGTEIAALRQTLERKEAEAERAAQEHVERASEIRRHYESSASWRLTAPLRRLTRLFRGRR